MRLLAESDPANPLVPALQGALANIATTPDPPEGFAARTVLRLARSYTSIAGQRWFLKLVLVVAGMVTLFSLIELSITVLTDPENARLQAYIDSTTGLLLIANLIAGALLVTGLLHLRASLLDAFRWFRRAVLVSLLIVQPLVFYEQQWTALIDLALNLALLSALEFGIARKSVAAGHTVPSNA